MNDIEIVGVPQPIGIFAGELSDRANDYLDAARALDNMPGEKSLYPIYFLVAHALELLLKASLASQGMPKIEIKALGHKLPALRKRIHSTSITDNVEMLISALHEMNSLHDFRYPTGYNLHLPSLKICFETLMPFSEKVKAVANRERVIATLEWQCSTREFRGIRKYVWSD